MKLKFSLLFFSFCLIAGAQIQFQKYFSDLIEYQKFSTSPIDGSYVIAGSKFNEGSFYDFCVVKLDKNGTMLWSKSFPSANDEFLSALSITPAGDILLSGYKSGSKADYDFSLMKLNAAGNLQWYKIYGTASSEIPFYAGQTSVGDFVLIGNREANQLPMVLKTNNSGTVLWSKTFGTTTGAEEGLVATVTKDEGMIVSGTLPTQKSFLMKINPDGTTAWVNTYTSPNVQYLSSLKQTSDGGYILASSDYRCDNTGCRSYFSFIKLNATGNVSWAKAVEKYLGTGRSAVETSDGGFVFTGLLRDSGYNKAALIKTDGNGILLWTKAYGNATAFGESFFVEQTSDGGFVLLGVEDSKAYLIKTDANGNSGCNEKILNPVLSNVNFAMSTPITVPGMMDSDTVALSPGTEALVIIKDSTVCLASGINEIVHTDGCVIYPSPFRESTTIEVIDYNVSVVGLEFNLYNVVGKKVMRLPITDRRLLISRGNIPSGMYFYEVRNAERIIGKGKIITQ